jgi:hypothetical protein
MKDTADKKTVDLLDGSVKRGRGRPRVDNPKTAGQRVADSRLKKRVLLDAAVDAPQFASNQVLALVIVKSVQSGLSPARGLAELCKRFPDYLEYM